MSHPPSHKLFHEIIEIQVHTYQESIFIKQPFWMWLSATVTTKNSLKKSTQNTLYLSIETEKQRFPGKKKKQKNDQVHGQRTF